MIIAFLFFSFCYCDKISWQRPLKRERVQLAHSSWWHHCKDITGAGHEGSGYIPSRQELWHPLWYWIDAHMLVHHSYVLWSFLDLLLEEGCGGGGQGMSFHLSCHQLSPHRHGHRSTWSRQPLLKILCQVILDVSSWQLRKITVLWRIFPYWYNYCSSDLYLKYDLYINKYFDIFWSFMKFNIWVCF